MLGTLVNVTAIILGALLGGTIGARIEEKYKTIVMNGLALTVIVVGLSMAIKAQNILLMIISIVVGSIIGQALHIEEKLNLFGEKMQELIEKNYSSSTFAKGLVVASLIYCVGSMAVVGAIEDGLRNNPDILYAKSVIDGFSAIIFASTFGYGVLFSFIPVLIYQGGISILSSYANPFLSEWVVNELSAVGGILIMAIGISVLKIKEIKVGNMLPAIFIPIVYGIILKFFINLYHFS